MSSCTWSLLLACQPFLGPDLEYCGFIRVGLHSCWGKLSTAVLACLLACLFACYPVRVQISDVVVPMPPLMLQPLFSDWLNKSVRATVDSFTDLSNERLCYCLIIVSMC